MIRPVYVFTLERRVGDGIRPWMVVTMDPVGAVIAFRVLRDDGQPLDRTFEHAIELGAHAQELHHELAEDPIRLNEDVTRGKAPHTFEILTEIEERWHIRGLLIYRGVVEARLRMNQAIDAHVQLIADAEFEDRRRQMLAIPTSRIPRRPE